MFDLPHTGPSGSMLRHARFPGTPATVDIRIEDGRIRAIGPDLPSDRAPATDLDGRIVLPGLWDAHVHIGQWARRREFVDVAGADSAAAAARRVTGSPGTGLRIGFGFRDGLWPDAPHKQTLDALAPDRAVVVLSNDLHTAWFSSAALSLVGHGGHPTGVLRERECFEAVDALPRPDPAALDRMVTDALAAAAARGVTGIIDFEFADNVADWARRRPDRMRVVASIPRPQLGAAIAGGLRSGAAVPGTEGLVTVGPVKIFADGSLNTRTAYCHDPYPQHDPSSSQGHGRLEIQPAELTDLLARARRHGIDAAVHAIGDQAMTIVLDAFERTACPGRIEHAQLVRPADLARCARPGLVLGVQPGHQPDDRAVADRYWAGRTGDAYPYAGLLRAGARLEFGSDAPVAPLDPWDAVAAAVNRTDDERPAWHPEQRLTARQALRAAARGRDAVAIGDPADLTVVERDPYALPGRELGTMPVYGTLVAGRWAFRADASDPV